MAGIAAAKGNESIGMTGVCWDCQILAVKVLSDMAQIRQIFEVRTGRKVAPVRSIIS